MRRFVAVWTKHIMNGIHLIADLYRCGCPPTALRDRDVLQELCMAECRDAGLTPLGASFFQFLHEDGEKAGVTGTVVPGASHLAIHTWPETGNVTLDVYVCNFSRDNGDCADRVFQRVIDYLAPQDQVSQRVVRGRLPAEV
jgi:S-adenosylmethionine/arginine decarboxylase-like enzyme